MGKYDVQISGSKTAKRTAETHKELKEIASKAQGRISVVYQGQEIFFGNAEDLLHDIELAEKRKKWPTPFGEIPF